MGLGGCLSQTVGEASVGTSQLMGEMSMVPTQCSGATALKDGSPGACGSSPGAYPMMRMRILFSRADEEAGEESETGSGDEMASVALILRVPKSNFL